MAKADIFISYARIERPRVEAVAKALASIASEADSSVFFDLDSIDAGDIFPTEIQDALDSSSVVVAFWTRLSLTRPWVRKECMFGLDRGSLVPVALEPLDQVPVQFLDVSYETLIEGDNDAPTAYSRMLRAVARRLRQRADASDDVSRLRKLAERMEYHSSSWQTQPDEIAARSAIQSIIRTSKAANPLNIREEDVVAVLSKALILPIAPINKFIRAPSGTAHSDTVVSYTSGVLPFDAYISSDIQPPGAILGCIATDGAKIESFLASWAFVIAKRQMNTPGGSVAYFCGPRAAETIATELLSFSTGIAKTRIRKGAITREDYTKLKDSAALLQTLPIHIDEFSSISLAAFIKRLARLQDSGHQPKIVFLENADIVDGLLDTIQDGTLQKQFIELGLSLVFARRLANTTDALAYGRKLGSSEPRRESRRAPGLSHAAIALGSCAA